MANRSLDLNDGSTPVSLDCLLEPQDKEKYDELVEEVGEFRSNEILKLFDRAGSEPVRSLHITGPGPGGCGKSFLLTRFLKKKHPKHIYVDCRRMASNAELFSEMLRQMSLMDPGQENNPERIVPIQDRMHKRQEPDGDVVITGALPGRERVDQDQDGLLVKKRRMDVRTGTRSGETKFHDHKRSMVQDFLNHIQDTKRPIVQPTGNLSTFTYRFHAHMSKRATSEPLVIFLDHLDELERILSDKERIRLLSMLIGYRVDVNLKASSGFCFIMTGVIKRDQYKVEDSQMTPEHTIHLREWTVDAYLKLFASLHLKQKPHWISGIRADVTRMVVNDLFANVKSNLGEMIFLVAIHWMQLIKACEKYEICDRDLEKQVEKNEGFNGMECGLLTKVLDEDLWVQESILGKVGKGWKLIGGDKLQPESNWREDLAKLPKTEMRTLRFKAHQVKQEIKKMASEKLQDADNAIGNRLLYNRGDELGIVASSNLSTDAKYIILAAFLAAHVDPRDYRSVICPQAGIEMTHKRNNEKKIRDRREETDVVTSKPKMFPHLKLLAFYNLLSKKNPDGSMVAKSIHMLVSRNLLKIESRSGQKHETKYSCYAQWNMVEPISRQLNIRLHEYGINASR